MSAVVAQVTAILQQMGPRRMSFQVVVDQLPMSNQTLRRRLANEGESWSGMLERERRRRLEESIDLGIRSGKRLADICGYRSESAFLRVFKKWYGMTFSEFKRRTKA